MPTTDLLVLVVYLLAMIGLGVWFGLRKKGSQHYMAAGGKLPAWAVGLSLFGTFLSSNTFLGVPGKAFGGNWNAFVFSLSLPLAAWIAVRWFVPFFRRQGHISAFYHLEERFGTWARTYAVVAYLLTQLARVGSILFGVALGLQALLGWDMATLILAMGVIVTAYTLLGGIEAVIWTDVIQSVLLSLGAVLILVLALLDIPGGWGTVWQEAYPVGKFSLGSLGVDLTESTFWVVLFYGLFMNLNNFGMDQNYVQRYHTAQSEQAAKRSVWLGALLYVPISALFFLIGTVLYVWFAHQEPAVALSGADQALPYFIVEAFPPGLAGLLIAALFAAAMSSVDSSLNSSATIVLSDLYQRYVKPDPTEQQKMRVLFTATLVWGAMGTGIGLALIGTRSLLDAWWTLSGIFAGGVLGLFLLGMLARTAGKRSALLGVSIGLLVIGWMTFSPQLPAEAVFLRSTLHTNLIIVVGTFVIFGVGWLFRETKKTKASG